MEAELLNMNCSQSKGNIIAQSQFQRIYRASYYDYFERVKIQLLLTLERTPE